MSEQATEATAPIPKVYNVPITKAKTTMAIDVSAIPDEAWDEIVLQGLKVILNRGTSKVTKETYPKPEELQAKAKEVAEAQLELVMTNKVKITGGKKKSGATGAVMTEARRLAKAIVKDELKKLGYKISHIEASQITALANSYLETEPGKITIKKAEQSLEDRKKIVETGGIFDISAVHVSEKLVAKAEAKKAKSGTLSAKQAGMVAKKAKPFGASATQH